jgi:hypothetical protein
MKARLSLTMVMLFALLAGVAVQPGAASSPK